jgi:hypothetical protein
MALRLSVEKNVLRLAFTGEKRGPQYLFHRRLWASFFLRRWPSDQQILLVVTASFFDYHNEANLMMT